MAFKRKASGPPPGTRRFKRGGKMYKKKKNLLTNPRAMTAAVNRVLNRKIETKQSTYTTSDGVEIFHNNFMSLENGASFLATTQGTQDPMSGVGQRIGDEITLKGISFKMMVELNERYSDVTFKVICVRAAKGDTPTRDTLFAGVSGNKMIDNFNRERYSIIFTKTFKVVAANQGTTGAMPAPLIGGSTGWNEATGATTTLSRATRIVKFYIPGSKFSTKGNVKYENNATAQVKFYDYHLLLYAYSNYSTNQDAWFVGRLNDYVKTMYYTDA